MVFEKLICRMKGHDWLAWNKRSETDLVHVCFRCGLQIKDADILNYLPKWAQP